jgi:hypothetical protein
LRVAVTLLDPFLRELNRIAAVLSHACRANIARERITTAESSACLRIPEKSVQIHDATVMADAT